MRLRRWPSWNSSRLLVRVDEGTVEARAFPPRSREPRVALSVRSRVRYGLPDGHDQRSGAAAWLVRADGRWPTSSENRLRTPVRPPTPEAAPRDARPPPQARVGGRAALAGGRSRTERRESSKGGPFRAASRG